MKKVSIIIPVYNMAGHISKTIDSALAQTHENIEVVVVDDGSTDNSPDIIKKYKDKVTYVKQENKGLCGALNTGLEVARGEFIALLDHDDIYMPEKIERQVDFFTSHPGYELVYSDGMEIDDFGNVIKDTFNSDGTFLGGHVFKELFHQMFVSGPTMMIPMSVLSKVGYFDPSCRVQDYQMALKIAYHYPIGFVDEKLYCHRSHGTNMSSNAYIMVTNELETLLTAIKNCPDIEEIVGKKAFGKRLSEAYYRAARVEMLEYKNFSKANKYLYQSVIYKPSLMACIAIAGGLLGLDFISAMKRR